MTHGTDSIDSPTYGTFGNGGGGRGGGEPEPQYILRMFGEVVKTFRRRARLTQEQFAPLVGYSPETVASIEQGRRLPPPDFAERADSLLDAFGVILAAAKHLTRRKGLASWFRQWAELELSALSLYTYECRLIPGLLQTAAYARTLFADQLPPLADEQIEAQLAARLDRQQLLRERPNTSFGFILEEHLFLRDLGGDEVTRELLDHILDLSELRNVNIQIMPLVRHHHAGLDGPMQLLETQDHQWFGYLEGQRFGQFVSDPGVISALQMRCANMRSQALSLDDSQSLMRRMRGAR
ncbi:Scr1 family TA system antitoxin-like transcriptional regulator [Streptomyces sp. NPDC088719]|uniref:helix-turn-helix domain-containing protein n=1 Tax=Streptomyces sp. NPDC088719 TaxID=3365872 RepID=UPI003828DE4C